MIPEFLIEQLNNQYGQELTKQILEGYNKKRNNPIKFCGNPQKNQNI